MAGTDRKRETEAQLHQAWREASSEADRLRRSEQLLAPHEATIRGELRKGLDAVGLQRAAGMAIEETVLEHVRASIGRRLSSYRPERASLKTWLTSGSVVRHAFYDWLFSYQERHNRESPTWYEVVWLETGLKLDRDVPGELKDWPGKREQPAQLVEEARNAIARLSPELRVTLKVSFAADWELEAHETQSLAGMLGCSPEEADRRFWEFRVRQWTTERHQRQFFAEQAVRVLAVRVRLLSLLLASMLREEEGGSGMGEIIKGLEARIETLRERREAYHEQLSAPVSAPNAQVAEFLGIAQGTVASRLASSRSRLRELLKSFL